MTKVTVKEGEEAKIPIIDLNAPNAASELLDAAVKYGFIFVRHTDKIKLSSRDVDSMFELSRTFFAAPQEVKAECTINSAKSGKNHGWLAMHKETLDPGNQKKGDFKEAFNIGEFVGGRAQQPLPDPLRLHENQIGKFEEDCHAVCGQILDLLAIALEIPTSEGGSGWFSKRHNRSEGPSGSVLRLLYYPALPESVAYNPDEDIRAGAHSDYGSITLLFRLPSQPGLEVLTPAGNWATVPVDPEPEQCSGTLPILVNIGDLLSYWTNGLLKSTVHRVIFPAFDQGSTPAEDRYSIAYFCHPEDSAELVEIPSQVVRGRTNKIAANHKDGPALTARDHLNSRLAATYGV